MKLVRILTTLALSLSMMAAPALATAVSPSPAKEPTVKLEVTVEADESKTIGEIYDANKEFERDILEEELILTHMWHLGSEEHEVHDAIEATLLATEKELTENKLADLVPGFADKWAEITEGAPVENAVVTDIFDVRYNSVADGFMTKLLVEGKSATFDIVVEGVTKDTLFVVGHKPSDTNEWVLEDYTISEDGVITISVDSLSPFFIAMDNNAAPDSGETPDSPQTGVDSTALTLGVAAVVVLGALAVVLIKKFRKVTDQ